MRQENWGEDGQMEREGKSIVGREGSRCKPAVGACTCWGHCKSFHRTRTPKKMNLEGLVGARQVKASEGHVRGAGH